MEGKMNGVKMEIQMTRRLASRKTTRQRLQGQEIIEKLKTEHGPSLQSGPKWLHQAYTLALIILPAFRCSQEQEELPLLENTLT